MKNKPHTAGALLTRRLGKLACLAGLAGLVPLLNVASAGSFSSDFNSGLPAGTTVYGASAVQSSGGYTNSGYLQLTPLALSTNGTFIITNDLDAGTPVVAFTARFKAYIYSVGTGADGISFNFAPDLPEGLMTEEGAGSGLTVEFDTFSNDTAGGTDLAGIDVKVNGAEYAATPLPDGVLRPGTWVDVVIQLHPDSTLDVFYDGTQVYTNLNLINFGFPGTVTAGKFGFGARTGGFDDNQWIEDLDITTYTAGQAYVDSFRPIGRTVRGDAPVSIQLVDNTTAVDASSIALQFDGATVQPTITQNLPSTIVQFTPPALLAPLSTHSISLTFRDNATPAPNTTTWAWSFQVANYSNLSSNLLADAAYVNTAAQGFWLRYSQVADEGSRDLSRAELQLAGLLLDGSTGLPYPNLAAPNAADGSFTYRETNVLNYGYPAAYGNFQPDASVPGLPGPSTGNGNSYALDAVAYLHLNPGLYTLGVNSSDGFKLVAGDSADVFAPQQAIFNGVRAPADSTATFAVAQAGYYPFRLLYFTGDPNYGPAPGTATPDLEFYSVDATGTKTLVNDTNVAGYVPAFLAAKTKPYVRSISPNNGDSGVAGNVTLSATLVDGSVTVQTGTISLVVNGATVTPEVNTSAGVTTVSSQPTTAFLPNSSNYVALAFTDSDSNRRTNSWYFTVANIMTPVWSIAAVNGTWVTAGSSERGLAYNPKTGHLILVSRAASPAPAGGLGIAILDSSTGTVLGTMNIGDIASTGAGLFKLSMVDVADDGVIYVANLASASTPFRVYRWSDESSAPQLVFDANPLGQRVGDDFRVRGSGAGTQIIASGNTSGTTSNLTMLTTVDGTNFTATILSPFGLAKDALRLGLAFGCGNTIWGETTATPASMLSFVGPPSTNAALVASYDIYDRNTNHAIGPIGLDIANQRLIGNQTVAPHSINLFDVAALQPTPAKNFPIDQRNYASQNTSFGTGSVDFTPDGSHVFCLDTGNGIIAFHLAPKLAAPVICAHPQNFLAAGQGGVGFMDVTAMGAPQNYQWRFNGAPLANATNRTLDIYNLQNSQLGRYSVVITNSMGSVTSLVAILDTRMAFTQQPADQVVPVGGTAAFGLSFTNGLPPYSYQWTLFGTNLPTGTAASLNITGVQVANAGPYAVAVTDALGQSITSSPAILIVGNVGTGTGLMGDYFNIPAFTEPAPPDPFTSVPAVSEIETTINFDWGTGPGPGVGADYFTARWHGKVQPFYSELYTFWTRTDDGARLWVNGQMLVDRWVPQAPTEASGSIALTKDQQYDILMEYYEKTGGAVAQLSWSSPSQPKVIVPMTQLYPASGPFASTFTSKLSNGTNLLINWTGTGVLETAPSVTGPWTPVLTNAGPFTIGTGAAAESYFRLLSQQTL